jgi:hypothetical protein
MRFVSATVTVRIGNVVAGIVSVEVPEEEEDAEDDGERGGEAERVWDWDGDGEYELCDVA